MRITQATLEHLDLLTPLFVKYREFYGSLPYPDSSRAFLEKRLRRADEQRGGGGAEGAERGREGHGGLQG